MFYVPTTDQDRYRFVIKTKLKHAFRQFGVNEAFESSTVLNVLNKVQEKINTIQSFSELKKIEDTISEKSFLYDGLTFYGFHSFITYSNPAYGPIAIYGKCGADLHHMIVKKLKQLSEDGGDQSLIGRMRTKLIREKSLFLDLMSEEGDLELLTNFRAITDSDIEKLEVLADLGESHSPAIKTIANNIEYRLNQNYDQWVQSNGIKSYVEYMISNTGKIDEAIQEANPMYLCNFIKRNGVVSFQ